MDLFLKYLKEHMEGGECWRVVGACHIILGEGDPQQMQSLRGECTTHGWIATLIILDATSETLVKIEDLGKRKGDD